MPTRRRGLTVIELVLIIVAVVAVIVLLVKLRGRDDASAASASAALDSLGASGLTPAAPGAGSTLAQRLVLATSLDGTAAAGDTLTVRVRVTTDDGTGVANAVLRATVDGGGSIAPDSTLTSDLGEATLRWTLGPSGAQMMRATVPGSGAPALEATVRVGGASTQGR